MINEIPTTIYKGEAVSFRMEFDSYSSAEYSLTVKFRCQNGPGLDISGQPDGKGFIVELEPNDTNALTEPCLWQAWLAKLSDPTKPFVAAAGKVRIEQGFTAAPNTPVDTRSTAKKIVDALEAALQGSASREQYEYEISTPAGTRRIRYLTRSEQIAFLKYYKQIVAREQAAERIRKTGNFGKTVLINVREA